MTWPSDDFGRLIRDVQAVFRALADDRDIGAVVVSGSGRMFTAGLDCKALSNFDMLRHTTYPISFI
jgi:enoyl-CoA hydratase/carnithine racemase